MPQKLVRQAPRPSLRGAASVRDDRTERRVYDIVQDLRGGADDDDLVLEKSAVVVVGVPEFRIENLVKRSWRIGLVGAEADEARLVIARHVAPRPICSKPRAAKE